MSADLVEFLNARLDEDEARADDAWKAVANGAKVWDRIHPDVVSHVARYVPDRVLAEVEAKRRIIEEHHPQPWHVNVGGRDEIPEGTPYCGRCGDGEWYAVAAPCNTLRLIALPYAAHPDYQQEWRPDRIL